MGVYIYIYSTHTLHIPKNFAKPLQVNSVHNLGDVLQWVLHILIPSESKCIIGSVKCSMRESAWWNVCVACYAGKRLLAVSATKDQGSVEQAVSVSWPERCSRNVNLLIDRLSCGFTSHSSHNRSFRRHVEKTKPNTTKAYIHQSKEMTQTHTHKHTRLTALFRDYPGEPVPER